MARVLADQAEGSYPLCEPSCGFVEGNLFDSLYWREFYRRLAMFGRLLVSIYEPDQIRLAERPSQKRQSRRKRAVRISHRRRDRRKPSLRREHLAVVARGALQVADFTRPIAPCRIDDGVEFVFLHRLQQSLAKCDVARVVIQIFAGSGLRRGLNSVLQSPFDVRRIEPRLDDCAQVLILAFLA